MGEYTFVAGLVLIIGLFAILDILIKRANKITKNDP